MKKYAFILSVATMLFTITSCVKDGYATAEGVKYKVEFETNDAAIMPGGSMTLYNNAFDTTMVKSISEETAEYQKYSWSDIVYWEKSSGMKINPDSNTKASLLVTFKGNVVADIEGDFGQEVKFIKTYEKSEFKK